MQADLPGSDPLAALFAEELGLVLEVDPQHEQAVLEAYSQAGLQPASIGSVAADSSISIAVSGQPAISGMNFLMLDLLHLLLLQSKQNQAGSCQPSCNSLCKVTEACLAEQQSRRFQGIHMLSCPLVPCHSHLLG